MSSVTDSDVCDTDVMLLRFLELLSDNQVVRKLRIQRIPETGEGEDTTLTILELVNAKMAVTPQSLKRTL